MVDAPTGDAPTGDAPTGDAPTVEAPMGEAPALKTILDPMILRFAVLTYLVVLPVGQLIEIPVSGTMAAGSDFFLALVLLAGVIELGRVSGPYVTGKVEKVPLLSGHGAFHMSTFFVIAFAMWVALGASWSLHPSYALAKGLAFAAMGLGALAIVWCGATWEKAADAWLLGTAVCLVVTWLGVLVGPEVLQTRLVYGGGSISGLPILRVSGPFPHPNMFGIVALVALVALVPVVAVVAVSRHGRESCMGVKMERGMRRA